MDPLNTASEDDWEQHWATFGDAARENPANVFRAGAIARLLVSLGLHGRLVDIGCGEGDLLLDLHRHFPNVELLGVDISQEGIERAKALVPDARFLRADLLSPSPEFLEYARFASFGVCSEVLEHLDDPASFLRRARTLLVPGSPIVITVPAGPRSTFDRYIGHRRHFTKARLGNIVEGAGLEVVKISSAGFPFFTLYRLTVIARGKRLLADAKVAAPQDLSFAARVALATFRVLFRFNFPSFPLGWQLVAVARVPKTDLVNRPN